MFCSIIPINYDIMKAGENNKWGDYGNGAGGLSGGRKLQAHISSPSISLYITSPGQFFCFLNKSME